MLDTAGMNLNEVLERLGYTKRKNMSRCGGMMTSVDIIKDGETIINLRSAHYVWEWLRDSGQIAPWEEAVA